MMNSTQISKEIQITYNSKVYNCKTIAFVEMKGKDFEIAAQIEELLSEQMVHTMEFSRKLSQEEIKVSDDKDNKDNKDMWSSLINSKMFRAKALTKLKNIILLDFVFLAPEKDAKVSLKAYIDELSIADIKKILGEYLDCFFMI